MAKTLAELDPYLNGQPEAVEPAAFQVPNAALASMDPFLNARPPESQIINDYMQQVPPTQAIPPTAWEKFGHGASKISDGVKQYLNYITNDPMGPEFEKYVNESDALYQKGRAEDMPVGEEPGLDLASAGGEAGMLSPFGLVRYGAGALRTIGKMGAAGGAASAMSYTPEGVDSPQKAAQIGMGAVTNAAMPFALKGAGYITGKTWTKAADISRGVKSWLSGDARERAILQVLEGRGADLDALPDAIRRSIVKEARKHLRQTGEINTDALANKAFLEAAGFTGEAAPLRSQLTRNSSDWGFEQNMATQEAGSEIQSRLMAQQQRLRTMGDDIANATRGAVASPYRIGVSLKKVVDDKFRETGKEVSELYKQVRRTVGETGGVARDRLVNAMAEISDSAKMDAISESVRRRLTRMGQMEDGQLIANPAQPWTVNKAEELRKFIGTFREGADPTERMAITKLIRALDDDVLDSVGDDAFGAARQAAKQRFDEFESLERILDGTIPPEDIGKRFIEGGTVDQLLALRSSLLSGATSRRTAAGMPERQRAWNSIRRSVWEGIMDKARDAKGQVTAFRLNKALDRFEPEEIEILFPEARGAIETLRESARMLTDEPPFSPVNRSGTFTGALDAAARLIPGVGEGLNAAKAISQGERLRGSLEGTIPAPAREAIEGVAERAANHPVGKAAKAAAGIATRTAGPAVGLTADDRLKRKKQ